VLGATGVLLLELAVPLRPLLTLFGSDHPGHLALPLLLVAAQTAVVAGAVTAVAFRLARSRT
jgi:uncharacterized membrane protein